MPQPEGAELEEIRARRERLRERYLRRAGDRPDTTAAGVHHVALICRDVEENDPLLPGLSRVPAGRAGREPRLCRLQPLLLRHRPPQPVQRRAAASLSLIEVPLHFRPTGVWAS